MFSQLPRQLKLLLVKSLGFDHLQEPSIRLLRLSEKKMDGKNQFRCSDVVR